MIPQQLLLGSKHMRYAMLLLLWRRKSTLELPLHVQQKPGGFEEGGLLCLMCGPMEAKLDQGNLQQTLDEGTATKDPPAVRSWLRQAADANEDWMPDLSIFLLFL